MYCKSLTNFSRRNSHQVKIGNVTIGGETPVMVQTMLSTATSDIAGSVAQVLRSVDAGAQVVRITVPAMRDIEHLKQIKAELRKQGCEVPLVADIHFNQKIAFEAAKVVEKVRINPGNFADSKSFKQIEYSDDDYNAELKRVKDAFIPLIDLCKNHNTALRIGTNHGSLSDRIMSKFGDTPLGMAESAMEFIRICAEAGFADVVVSMKASNTLVMMQATRLLVNMMNKENLSYPIHLGVTEAGEGEDGRIKSAVGIGALLADGIGDTIRVSLTEDPEAEIPVARKLLECFSVFDGHSQIAEISKLPYDPYRFKRRKTAAVLNIGGGLQPIVILSGNVPDDGDLLPDYIAYSYKSGSEYYSLNQVTKHKSDDLKTDIPLVSLSAFNSSDISVPCFVSMKSSELTDEVVSGLKLSANKILVISSDNANKVADIRSAIIRLANAGVDLPVVARFHFDCASVEELQINASAYSGSLLLDGLLDGIWISNGNELPAGDICSVSFGILQATRMRVTKPDYISCPSCGRTQFNIQDTTKVIRAKTAHLKGLKIGIMGCIVNGLGEMADADYGYIGGAPGKVNLYYNKELIKRGVVESEAVDELIDLIKSKGDWVEPN